MSSAISELIKSPENDKVSKISKHFYETFFEQSFRGDSVSINEETELSREEQNDRIILLLLCLAIVLSSFAFLPTFFMLMNNIMSNSEVTIAGKQDISKSISFTLCILISFYSKRISNH